MPDRANPANDSPIDAPRRTGDSTAALAAQGPADPPPTHQFARVLALGGLGGAISIGFQALTGIQTTTGDLHPAALFGLGVAMGVGAAPLFVFLVANTDRRDRIRLWSLALLAGIFWGPVFKGAEGLVGSHFDRRAAGDAVEIAGQTSAEDLQGLVRWLSAMVTPLDGVSQIELRQRVLRDAGQTLNGVLQSGQVQLSPDEWHTLAEAHPDVMYAPVFYEQIPEPAWLEPSESELQNYVLRDSDLRERVFDEELIKRTEPDSAPGTLVLPASFNGVPWRGLPRPASIEADASGEGVLIDPPPGIEWELLEGGRLRVRPGALEDWSEAVNGELPVRAVERGELEFDPTRPTGADVRLDMRLEVLRSQALERVARRQVEGLGDS